MGDLFSGVTYRYLASGWSFWVSVMEFDCCQARRGRTAQLYSDIELEGFRCANEDDNEFVCLGHSPHAYLSVTYHAGGKLLSAARRSRTLRESRLHEDEIYICEFFCSSLWKMVKTSSRRVSSLHITIAVVTRIFFPKNTKKKMQR